jgi:hypothetical protein
METLSVNLSRGDVTVLLGAVEQAIAACSCGRAGDGRPCLRCTELRAVRGDLASVVARRPARRAALAIRWRDNPSLECEVGGAHGERRGMDC